MNTQFKKKYKNKKYPDKTFYSNMILSENQLNNFLKNNNKIKLLNNNKDNIKLNSKLEEYLNNKINNKLYKIEKNNRDIILEKTFKYIYYNTLTGIYVKIINNQLKIFYLFYNEDYKNDWINNINIPKFYKNLNRKNINKDKSKWSVNNCIIDNRTITNDTKEKMEFNRLLEFKYFLKLLCKKYTIKDIDFFINRRDFPIVRNDGKHPYNHAYNNIKHHSTNKFIPIFSQSTSPKHTDIPIINIDDITMLTNITYPPKNSKITIPTLIPWDEKKNVAFFRGTATGCGVLQENNQRIKLAKVSFDLNDVNILDAGLVSWNYRDKLYQKKMTLINPKKLGFPLVNKVSPQEQLKYKYIIHVDGHVAAYRLSRELYSGSVILLVKSENNYSLWITPLLKEWEHYVPIKKDLSDLIDKIKWCQSHDKECKNIANNALKLAREYITLEYSLKYFSYCLNLL